ncbi:MAG: hypothetical protein Q9191_007884 [Dirinaria sp. TL-2023a]
MSLYYDAASLLQSGQSGSLKSRVFGARDLKSPPTQVFALLTEASKWSEILAETIEKSLLLEQEKKLSPSLAILLVHDLLLSKKGVAAPAAHPLRVAVSRYKARLSAELTKARLKRGFSSTEALKEFLDRGQTVSLTRNSAATESAGGSGQDARLWAHPRWIRINTIKTTLKEQLTTTFQNYKLVDSLEKIIIGDMGSGGSQLLHIDQHIPDLVAVHPNPDLVNTAAYREGCIIFHDKASCFPAYLLGQPADGRDCIDACAAPGNKTTHLAAIMRISKSARRSKIFACERDQMRASTLQKMVSLAGAEDQVSIRTGQDFLKLDPQQPQWDSIGSILLDPSCSGSGIIGRDGTVDITLPSRTTPQNQTTGSKKRKRHNPKKQTVAQEPYPEPDPDPLFEPEENPQNLLQDRLEALSHFQLKLLTHAFQFPNASRIVYSTCSVHAEENEHVVVKALRSAEARGRAWRIMQRAEQPHGLRIWHIRGDRSACTTEALKGITVTEEESGSAEVIAASCIRCNKHSVEGTQGFFVAGFVRSVPYTNGSGEEADVSPKSAGDGLGPSSDSEWEGLSD